MSLNFTAESISENSKLNINSLVSNDRFDIKELEKVEENLYKYVLTAEDEGKTELRFFRGNDAELWNCSPIFTYDKYVQGFNCITINGWNESGEYSYYDDYTQIDQRIVIAVSKSDEGVWNIEWAEDENIISFDVYVRCDELGFVKTKTIEAPEAVTSVAVDETLIRKFADYYVVGTATDGKEIESNIVTLVKDEEGICYEDTIDTDEDGIPDGYEYLIGTDASLTDTDGDGFSDGYEAFSLCTNPLVADENTDFDSDGLTNFEELKIGTNPYIADSDFDGINDSIDVEPIKTNVNTGIEANYEIPVKMGQFDLLSRYYDEYGNKCKIVYNYLNGNVKYMTNSKNESYNVYNDRNQITAAIEYVDGGIIANTYSYADGNVETITHNGFQYEFQYDIDNNMTLVKVADRTLITNQYEESKLISETYGNGSAHEYVYDENGNVIAQKVNGNTLYEWKYDEDGNLTVYRDLVKNETFQYTYDEGGSLTDINSDLGFNISYADDENKYSITYECDGAKKSQTTTELEETDEEGNTNNTITTNLISGGKFEKVVHGEELTQKSVYINGIELLSSRYTYSDKGVTKIEYQDGKILEYTYDNAGNIVEVKENGSLKLSYEYDSLGQLTRENNSYANRTYAYEYDNAGNIILTTEYSYGTGALSSPISQKIYRYEDGNWKDLLTSFNGQTITYDEIGNPLNYRDDMKFLWSGRQLAYINIGSNEISYIYNSKGIRTSKIVNGVTTTYNLEGTKIISETTGDVTKWYIYDENDKVIGFEYNGNVYYFEKNAQDDVIIIFDENGNSISKYIYDAWGNVVDIQGDKELAQINPFRYRGYYQDNETGFYYLQSRYYDSYVGRFLNADDIMYLGISGTMIGYNQYIYSINNPINYCDYSGHYATQFVLNQSIIAQLSVAMAGIISSINVSVASIKVAIATSWITAVCIAATAIAIVGIIYTVNRVTKLMAIAAKTITAVQNCVKLGGLDKRKLNKNTVYVITRKNTTDVVYVGRTNNYERRQYSHQRKSSCKFPESKYDMYPIATGLSLTQARALEQTIITAYTLETLNNMINSISPRKWSTFKSEFKQMQTLIEASFNPE